MLIAVPLLALIGHPTGPDTLVQRREGKTVKQAVWLVPMVVMWPIREEGAGS